MFESGVIASLSQDVTIVLLNWFAICFHISGARGIKCLTGADAVINADANPSRPLILRKGGKALSHITALSKLARKEIEDMFAVSCSCLMVMCLMLCMYDG